MSFLAKRERRTYAEQQDHRGRGGAERLHGGGNNAGVFTPRHRWAISKIASNFGIDASEVRRRCGRRCPLRRPPPPRAPHFRPARAVFGFFPHRD